MYAWGERLDAVRGAADSLQPTPVSVGLALWKAGTPVFVACGDGLLVVLDSNHHAYVVGGPLAEELSALHERRGTRVGALGLCVCVCVCVFVLCVGRLLYRLVVISF